MLLVIPALAAAARLHRSLNVYAPSNVLTLRVRASHQSKGIAVNLVVPSGSARACDGGGADRGSSRRAPVWLNLVVLLLAWDAASSELSPFK